MRRITLSQSAKKKLREKGVQLVFVYGSVVSGHFGPRPDLDVGIVLVPGVQPSLDLYSELYYFFTEILPFPGKELDLVFLNQVSLPLQLEVAYEGKLLYEREKGAAFEYKEMVTRQYLDFQHHLKKFDAVLLEAIR
ncbi:MAG: nucleotidyltransferase domain-containing protein [Candidatus Omnitrophica bacterium]|nr:nucleotidyltransferase domain-containing protein [Candidatus Omnitrophota bacterium]